MFDLTIIVPVIMALVTSLKKTGVDSRYAPLLSIGFGMLFYSAIGEETLALNLLNGLVAGLTASGLYSGVKASFK